MKATTKTILDEITDGFPQHHRKMLIESRGHHIIAGAINLLQNIRESYGAELADEMERRLINSIKAKDAQKFARAARRLS